MDIIHFPVNATYLGSFRLLIEFENGELRIADFSRYLKKDLKSFNDLKTEDYFKKFYVREGILEWPNGWDVAPDYLYDISTPADVRPVKRKRKATSRKE